MAVLVSIPWVSAPLHRTRRAAVFALVTLIVLLASSCSEARPSVAEWQPVWDRVTAALPGEETVGIADPPTATCTETLAFLRENRADLLPTPDLAIDDAVTQWVEIAEEAFFECPPRSGQIGSFAEAYAELDRLQAEIELVLDMDQRSP